MRLKLVLIASLLAAIIGAGSSVAIIYWTIGPMGLNPRYIRPTPGWLAIVIRLPPVLLALFASFFVYRHTARRRKLQGALTVIMTIAFSLALCIAGFFLYQP
jgi:hypothetical protein